MIQTHTLVKTILGCGDVTTIQPLDVGQDGWRNELLFFIKPNLLAVSKQTHIARSLDLILGKLDEFEAHAHGILAVNGRTLDQLGIMNRHYGFINQLSRSASKILGQTGRARIAAALGITEIKDCEILGGHEYLAQHPEQNALTLNRLWRSKESVKLESGFYVQSYRQHGQTLILVNGFHPLQIASYTDPAHRIVVMLLHSDTAWAILRKQMIGATFPEKAVPQSIRGALYQNPQKFGLETVNIASNGVHLSAGPFEAMFEIVNFGGRLFDLDLNQHPPLLLTKMRQAGIDAEQARRTLDNPPIPSATRSLHLFAATEEMDTEQAIAFWKKLAATA